MHLKRLRSAFVQTFEEYVHEGAYLRDLLLSVETANPRELCRAVSDQQQRFDQARVRYDQTRELYMQAVMRGLHATRTDVLEAETEKTGVRATLSPVPLVGSF